MKEVEVVGAVIYDRQMGYLCAQDQLSLLEWAPADIPTLDKLLS